MLNLLLTSKCLMNCYASKYPSYPSCNCASRYRNRLGTSRFALEGNSLFVSGHGKGWAHSIKKEVGKEHLIKFSLKLRHSVENYAQNLNSSALYHRFRKARLKLIKNDRYVNNASSRLATHPFLLFAGGRKICEKILK